MDPNLHTFALEKRVIPRHLEVSGIDQNLESVFNQYARDFEKSFSA